MSLQDLFNSAGLLINQIISSFEVFFKLLFEDLPAIYGIKLGWWFLIFSFTSFLIYKIFGGGDN